VRDAAREQMGPWISSLREWDLFGTLTYDPAKIADADTSNHRAATVSVWKAQRDGRRFISEASKRLGRPVPAVLACEPHKSGSYHMHGVFDVGGLSPGDVMRMWAPWFSRHGFIKLEAPRSQADVSAYCGKYLAKELGELVFSRELLQLGAKVVRGVMR